MRQYKFNKILSFVLVMMMVITMIPTHFFPQALADDGNKGNKKPVDVNDNDDSKDENDSDFNPLAYILNEYWEQYPENRAEVTVSDGGVSVTGTEVRPVSKLAVEEVKDPFSGNRKSSSSSSIPGGGHFITLFDISLLKYDGTKYQPESAVEMTIDNVIANAEHDLRIIHILEDETAIREGIANGTAVPVENKNFVRTFSSQSKAASNVTNRKDVVYIEILSTHNGRLNVSDNADGTVRLDFEATSFSIYAVVDINEPEYVVRDTYYFENDDGTPFEFVNQAGHLVDNQIIKDNEALEDVGLPDIPAGTNFAGWFIYDKTTQTYGEQISFDVLISVGDTSDTFYVRPFFGEVTYFDFYEDCAGNVILQRKQVAIVNNQSQFDISTVTVNAPTAELAFVGWADTPGVNDDDRTTLTPGVITSDANGKKLYPVFKSAHWVSFQTAPTGSGATYIAPAFVLAGQSAASARPATDPEWTGHRFINWYTEETGGTVFNFNQVLTSDVTVYAHWDNANTSYSVVYWRQLASDSANLSDDQKNYEFDRIDSSRSAQVGSSVSPNNSDRNAGTGFTFNSNKSTTSAVVNADGSTVINVYYDRVAYTLTFRVNRQTVRTITELYEHNIFDKFPIVGTNGTTYTGYDWDDTGNTYPYVLASIDIMPAANVTFDGSYRGTNKLIIYYVEVIEGENAQNTVTFNNKTYKVSHVVEHNFNYLTYGEEYYPMVGYSQSLANAQPAFGRIRYNGRWIDNAANLGSSGSYNGKYYNNINKLYYTRNSYNLKFLNSINDQQVLNPQTVQYQKSLSEYRPSETQIPDSNIPGKVFKGWYKDKACTEEFDFSITMPAHEVVVYAGWEDEYYRVEIDPNGGQLSSSESTFFWETYGGLIEQYGDITRDYVEDPNGTFYYHYHPYSKFQEDDYNQPDYYSYWKRCAVYDETTTTMHMVYDPTANNGHGGYVDDQLVQDTYSDLTVKYKYEKDAYALVGWFKVITDDNGNERLASTPYNFSTPVTENIKLRAVWRRVGEYKVKYELNGVDANGNLLNGISSDGPAPVDGNTYADNSDTVMLTAVPAPTGYVFWGWYYNGSHYNPGEVFTLDADLADENKTIHIYPMFYKNEEVPVPVTQITYNGNGGTTSLTSDSENNITVSADNTSITYGALQINANQTVKDASLFYRKGYTLIGWNTNKTAADNGVVEYEFGQTVAADNLEPSGNTLYSVWQVKYYTITIYKIVDSIDPDDSTRTYYVNPTFDPVVPAYQSEDQEFTATNEFVFENIPYGTEFSLSEITDENYEVKYSSVLVKDADGEIVNTPIATDAAGNIVTGTVEGDITITYTNTRLTVDVDVTKTVENTVAEADFDDFEFTVSYGSGDNAVSETVTAKHNGGKSDKVTVPKGASVVITELNASGFTVTAEIDGTGLEVDTESNSVSFMASQYTTVDFTNTRPSVNVTVTKAFADDFNDDTGNFYFDLTEVNGAQEVLHKYTVVNESTVFENLPYGIQFTLSEDEDDLNEKYDSPDYELLTGGQITKSGNVYTATGDGTITVTNKVKRIPVTVTKTVDLGDDDDKASTFNFKATAKIGNTSYPVFCDDEVVNNGVFDLTLVNGTASIELEVPYGVTLTVEETGGGVANHFYTTTINGDEATLFTSDGALKDEAGITVAFVNTRELTVTVTKTMADGDDAYIGDDTFSFGFTDQNDFTLDPKSDTAKTKTFTIPYGTTFTLSEKNLDTNKYGDPKFDGTVVTANNGESSKEYTVTTDTDITVENNVRLIPVTVVKTVESNLKSDYKEYSFDYYLNDATEKSGTVTATVSAPTQIPQSGIASNSATATTVIQIPYGQKVKIVETTSTDSYVSTVSSIGNKSGNKVLSSNDLVVVDGYTAEFTNSRPNYTVTVAKATDDLNAVNDSFEMQLTKLAETVDGVALMSDMVTLGENASNAEFVLPAGMTFTFEEVLTDAQKLIYMYGEENGVSSPTYEVSGGVIKSENVYTVTDDGSIRVINYRNPIQVVIQKTVKSGLKADYTKYAFNYTYTYTDRDGNSQTENGTTVYVTVARPEEVSADSQATASSEPFTVPYGSVVTVTEVIDTDAFTVDSKCGTKTGNEVITTAALSGLTNTVEYTNERNEVELEITKKTVNFSNDDATFPFDVTVTSSYVEDGETKTQPIKDAHFDIAPDGTATLTVPYGTKVVITEDGDGTVTINGVDYYIKNVFTTSIAVDEDGTAGTSSNNNRTYTIDALNSDTSVTFTNTRKNVTVTLTKSLDNANLTDDWNNFAFRIDYEVTDDCAENANSNGYKNVAPGNETNSITVPYGAEVAVTEYGAGKYNGGTHTVEDTFKISYSDNNGTAFIADGEIQTKNERKTVEVDVAKVIDGPDAANDPANGTTFYFTVNDKPINTTVAGPSSGKISVPIFTNVDVEETTQLAGFTTQYKVGVDGTYTDGNSFTISDIAGSTTVYFKNTRTEIDVEVVKVVENRGVNDAWNNSNNSYVMDYVITRPDGTEFANGSVNGVVPDSTTGKTVSVPYGYKIKFTENADNKLDGEHLVGAVFDITYSNNNNTAITAEDVTVTVTNTRKLVPVKVIKAVAGADPEHDPAVNDDYVFTVDGINDGSITVKGDGVVCPDDDAVMEPIFTSVTITETNVPAGFNTSYQASTGESGTGAEAVIAKENLGASGVTVTFTNARDTRKVTVKKTVNNLGVQDEWNDGTYKYRIDYVITDLNGDKFLESYILVSPTAQNGVEITGIPYGYKLNVVEVKTSDDDQLFTVFDASQVAYSQNNINVTTNDEVITVTNVRNKNDVKVVKTLDNKGASDTNWTFKFDYTVKDAAGNSIASGTDVAITANDTTGVLIKDVPYGALVTVTENTALTGGANNTTIANTFTVTYSDNNGGAVTTNDAVITISNVRNTVTVTVNKEVKSDVEKDYTTREYTFNLTGDVIAVTGATPNSGKTAAVLVIDGTAANKKASFTVEIPYGTNLTVAEPTTLNPEFDVFTNGTKDTYSATLTNVIDNAQKVNFINRKNIDVTVVKKVVSNFDTDYTTYPFQVTYKDVDTGATVTVASNDTKAVVTKTEDGIVDGTFTFTVPYGTSTVQIVEQLGNAASSFSTAVTATGSTGTAGTNNQSYSITAINVNTTVTFTNTRIMQTVTVVKNVDSNLAADKNRGYTFTYGYTYITVDGTKNVTGETLAVTVTDTGSATISIPKNATNLVITEDEFNTDTTSVVKTTVKVNDADAVEAMSGTVASVVDNTNTVTFTNRRVVYVTVRKILDSLHADNDFSFTLKYTDTDGTAVTKNLTIEDVAAGTQGKAYTPAFEIPYGVDVTVTETTVENYKTFVLVTDIDDASVEAVARTKAITKGTVAAPTEFVFTNHRIVALKITKTVDSEEETPTLAYTFTVDYVYDDLSTAATESAHQETVTVTVDATTLKGESAYVYLPYGATDVVITETPVTGYDTAVNGSFKDTVNGVINGVASGTQYVKNVLTFNGVNLDAENNDKGITAAVTVNYTNTRMVEVKVTKELDSEETNDKNRKFNFSYSYTSENDASHNGGDTFEITVGDGSNPHDMQGSFTIRVPYGVTLKVKEVLTQDELDNLYYDTFWAINGGATGNAGYETDGFVPKADNTSTVKFSNKRMVNVNIAKIVDDPTLAANTNNQYKFTWTYKYNGVNNNGEKTVTVDPNPTDKDFAYGETDYFRVPYNAQNFTVTEVFLDPNAAADFDTTARSAGTSGSLSGLVYTLSANVTALETDIIYTNTRMIEVTIEKIVLSSDEADETATFDFSYAITRAADGKRAKAVNETGTTSITLANYTGTATVRMPYGSAISVTEVQGTEDGAPVLTDFQVLHSTTDATTFVETADKTAALDGVVATGEKVTFKNLKLYTVTVTKKLYNRDVDDLWNNTPFPMTFTVGNVIGNYTPANQNLADGASATFRVPYGATVSVEELSGNVTINGFKGDEIFGTTIANNNVTVQKDETIVVTNTRNTRVITIKKTVVSKVATDFRDYSFTKATESWASVVGNDTFTLTPATSGTAVETTVTIPVGLAFTVTEDISGDSFRGMDTSVSGDIVAHTDDNADTYPNNMAIVPAGLLNATVSFVNERVTADLTIEKIAPAGSTRTFIFEITTENDPDFDRFVMIQGSGRVTLTYLQTGYTYVVTELTDWSYEFDVSEITTTAQLLNADNSVAKGTSTFVFVDAGKVTFTNVANYTNWLRGEGYRYSIFAVPVGAGAATEAGN